MVRLLISLPLFWLLINWNGVAEEVKKPLKVEVGCVKSFQGLPKRASWATCVPHIGLP